jgi:hypothetical protein
MKPWKIQKFFGDLVYDLRNRGLLLPAVLLLVAMVAVPVVIAQGGSEPAPPSAASLADATDAPEGKSAVLAYDPGVRDYKKRLGELQEKDPFKAQFSEAAAAAAELSGTVSSGSVTSEPTSSGVSTGTVGTTGGGSKSKKKKKKSSAVKYYYYETDVLVGEANTELAPRNKLQTLTSLPSEDAPVVIYLGPSASGQFALFLVSNEVSQVSGPGTCVPNPEDCALLALGAGQTEDLVYDADGKTYRVTVTQIRRKVSSKLPL